MKPHYVYKWGVGPVRVPDIRARFRSDAKRLRRARRLYMRLCYDAIMDCPTECVLWETAEKCLEHGIYAPSGLRDVKNHILGHLFKISKRKGWEPYGWEHGWHAWIRENDFDMGARSDDRNRTRHKRNLEVA